MAIQTRAIQTPTSTAVSGSYERRAQRVDRPGPNRVREISYNDASAEKSIRMLEKTQGAISAEKLAHAVRIGAGDGGQAMRTEFEDFKRYLIEGGGMQRLTPDALAAWKLYENAHESLREQTGTNTINGRDFHRLLDQMRNAKANPREWVL